MSIKRVAIAMSGGVDSSLAAAILQQQGYDVFGVTMALQAGCSGNPAIDSAKSVAQKLGISHYVLDLAEIFEDKVVAGFCFEYSRGRTPNPCVKCNRFIKFGELLRRVRELGADFLATGHYARIGIIDGQYLLLKGADSAKDQSYFLYTLGQEQLEHILFPVGYLHKVGVRKEAAEMGLPSAERRESQDACFVSEGNYRDFLKRRVASSPGEIVDSDGKVLGKHQGLAGYTVGQRHGLGLPSNDRLYVLRLDFKTNRLIIGQKEQLLSNRLTAGSLSWVSGSPPIDLSGITAKIRYKAPETPVRLMLKDNTAEVEFAQPQSAITPGQAVVFYRGEAVLGGGSIEEAGVI